MTTRFVRISEVAQRFNIHRCTVYRWIANGEFPPPVRLSGAHGSRGGAVAWPEAEIDQHGQKLIDAREAHYRNSAPTKTSRPKK